VALAKLRAILRLMRVEQWYKNALVVIPALFSLKLADPSTYPRLAVGFASLSLASSANYVLNDIVDLERDKLHPRKRTRPLPSGQVRVEEALVYATALASTSLLLAVYANPIFALYVLALIALNQLYSLYLKEIAVIDVVTIAMNYLVRTASGSALVEVETSPWLFSGIFFLALFLAVSKRKAEIVIAGHEARKVLKAYNREWLNQALSTTAAMVMATYAVYCAEVPLGRRLIVTVPLVAFFLLRYTLAIEAGRGEQPHEIVMGDRATLISALMLIASIFLLVYAQP